MLQTLLGSIGLEFVSPVAPLILDIVSTDPSCVLDINPAHDVYTDTSGTVSATNGQLVAAIKEQKGGLLLTQSDDSSKPTYVTSSSWFGRPGLLFDDNTRMFLSNTLWNLAYGVSQWTWLCIFNWTGGGNPTPFGLQSNVLTPQFFNTPPAEFYVYPGSGGSARFLPIAKFGQALVIRFDGSQTGDANRMRAWDYRSEQTAQGFSASMPATLPAGSGISLGCDFAQTTRTGMTFLRLMGFNVALGVS